MAFLQRVLAGAAVAAGAQAALGTAQAGHISLIHKAAFDQTTTPFNPEEVGSVPLPGFSRRKTEGVTKMEGQEPPFAIVVAHVLFMLDSARLFVLRLFSRRPSTAAPPPRTPGSPLAD